VNPAGDPPGTIQFKFEETKEDEIPDDVIQRFTKATVDECFAGNRRAALVE